MLPVQTPTSVSGPDADPICLPPGISAATADHILALYLSGPKSQSPARIPEIAAELRLPLQTLGDVLESPYITHLLALIERLNTRRSEVIAGDLRTKALFATAHLAETAQREETRRLSAASLLRMMPFTPPATSASGRASAPSSAAPRSERSIVSAIASALNRSIKAESEALRQQEEEMDLREEALLASRRSPSRAAQESSVPSRSGTANEKAAAPTIAPAAGLPIHTPALLDQLAARMAAPPRAASHRPKSRDSPRPPDRARACPRTSP